MEYTFDQVADLLDEMAETFPPVFFEQLNGGILLQEEAKPDPMFPEGEVYFMGEYVQDSYLGRYINLYYGSFLALSLIHISWCGHRSDRPTSAPAWRCCILPAPGKA